MKYKSFCRLDCRGCADSICTECYAPELASDRPTNADWNRWLQTGTRPVNIVVTDPARYLDTHAEGSAGLLGSDGSWRVGAPSKIPYSGLGPASDAETTGEPEQHSVDPNGWLRRFAVYENIYTSHWLNDERRAIPQYSPDPYPQVRPIFGINFRVTRSCGHEQTLHFASIAFAEAERARLESSLCTECKFYEPPPITSTAGP